MTQYGYGVNYETQDGKDKCKKFETQEESKIFYDQRKKYGNAILFRFRKTNLIDKILGAHLVWLGFNVSLPCAVLLGATLILVYEIIWKGIL